MPDSSPERSWPGPAPFGDVLDRARKGDEASFAAVWRWLQPALLGWLRVCAAGMEEEAAAETWLSVTRGLDGFRGDDRAFRSWVFTIARRRAVDQARACSRRAVPTQLDDIAEPGDDPAEVVADDAASRDALALLAQLPPTQAQVVSLRVVAGLSVSETAEVVGKSDGAVRVLCHRGLEGLGRLVAAGEVRSSTSGPLWGDEPTAV